MGPKFGNQLEELENNIMEYQAISGKALDESVALAALTNVATKTEDILRDMRVNPSSYVSYGEMKKKLEEYAGILEMEIQLKNRKNIGGLNALTSPKKKKDQGGKKGEKGKDGTKDKGGAS